MISTETKERLNRKIQDGEFVVEDIPAYLTLFCQIGNEVDDLQDEVVGLGSQHQPGDGRIGDVLDKS